MSYPTLSDFYFYADILLNRIIKHGMYSQKKSPTKKEHILFFVPITFIVVFSVIFVTCRQIDLDPEGQYNH